MEWRKCLDILTLTFAGIYILAISVGLYYLTRNFIWPALFGLEWSNWMLLLVFILSPFLYWFLIKVFFYIWMLIPTSLIGNNKHGLRLFASGCLLITVIALIVNIWTIDIELDFENIIVAVLFSLGLLAFALKCIPKLNEEFTIIDKVGDGVLSVLLPPIGVIWLYFVIQPLLYFFTNGIWIALFSACENNNKDEIETAANTPSNLYTAIDEEESVWICTGRSSHAYHLYEDCKGLDYCKGYIEEMTLEEAEDIGRTPCNFCREREATELDY